MKNTSDNRSLPSVSYAAAMDLLVKKIGIYTRSSGKAAEHAFDEALCHARDAAHAQAFRRLCYTHGWACAMQDAEDIAQMVALRLFIPHVRARLIGYLPGCVDDSARIRLFSKVITFVMRSAIRTHFRVPDHESLNASAREDLEGRKLASLIERLAAPGAFPSEMTSLLDGLGRVLGKQQRLHDAHKAGSQIMHWSAAKQAIGVVDASDRPDESQLPKRSRQRMEQRVNHALRQWRDDPGAPGI